VLPSVQSARLRARTGRTGILASAARDGLAETIGVSSGAIFRVTRDEGRALQVIDVPCR